MNKEESTSMQEMVQYRERLLRQKDFLTDILSKIEKQILALQVERLHLKNNLIGSEFSNRKVSANTLVKDNSTNLKSVTDNHDPKSLAEQKLDLSVPSTLNNFEEEIEDDEITENEKLILEQFDLLL